MPVSSDPQVKTLEKSYDPQQIEGKWYAFWEENGCFEADPEASGRPFSMVIPPPNVTGSLHMGHALNNLLQDILARYHRQQGRNVLWMPGTDHAGIATQNVVERQLAAEGLDRHAIGREKFIERVWQWRRESGGTIINQLKRLGSSCDWRRERFTMDDGLSRAVREVFVSLYEEGLIYQGDYIINWCPRCHTALSDLEVEFEEHNEGRLWDLEYPLADGGGSIIVSTTRPETMLGDTAVAVNGADERYREMIGKEVVLPLLGRRIPIIADDYVDREFGSGAVKITPAHDANDFEVGLRHGLEMIKVMDEKGVMNENAGPYAGLTREACRLRVVADLEKQGRLSAIKDYQHNVGHCYRCRTIIEPYLSNQWFVKIKPLAERAVAAVQDGKTRIIPKNWEKTYFNWMENIRDWCISRQIWWGHRIPAWYCDACGKMIVARQDPTSCPDCGGPLRQETDVLDTWFSSGLWPFSTMGWPEQTATLKTYYPTSVLVTGFDILFFWVARMMMMGLKFMDEVPFRDVYIHALVRDEHGQKMSKSRGNVIDPLIIIDQYGADALRFTLAAFAAQGRDVSLSEARIGGYRNFVNKLWNAARFTLMNLEDFQPSADDLPTENLSLPNRWISHRLNQTIAEVGQAFDEYRFNDAAQVLYQFTWHEFCDWYLELVKPDLFQSEDQLRRGLAQAVLYRSLEQIVRLLHPIMPFVCEEIWQALPRPATAPLSLMQTSFPRVAPALVDPAAAQEMEQVMAVITAVRNLRGEMNLSPGRALDLIVRGGEAETLAALQRNSEVIMHLARLQGLTIAAAAARPPQSAAALAAGCELFVPLAGLVDFAQEAARLAKELKKVEKELAGVNGKLGNEKFLAKAPAEVLAKEQGKSEELNLKLEKLKASLRVLQESAL
ncbi:MAG: valine--tRNA ligase [Deltaproteobacteria bacterium]|nr:valine--tRNA ligase [Deltaproteobacteria bacterium]